MFPNHVFLETMTKSTTEISSSDNNKQAKSSNLGKLNFLIGTHRLFPTKTFTETPWLHNPSQKQLHK